MKLFLWTLFFFANALLGYLGVARSVYKERAISQQNNSSFFAWLPTFWKETLEEMKGGKIVEKIVDGKIVGETLTKPDRSMILPFLPIAALGGFLFFLGSFYEYRKRG